MVKRKTLESEYVQRRCVIPSRKAKEKAFRDGKYAEFVTHSMNEEACKTLRENYKK